MALTLARPSKLSPLATLLAPIWLFSDLPQIETDLLEVKGGLHFKQVGKIFVRFGDIKCSEFGRFSLSLPLCDIPTQVNIYSHFDH